MNFVVAIVTSESEIYSAFQLSPATRAPAAESAGTPSPSSSEKYRRCFSRMKEGRHQTRGRIGKWADRLARR